MTANGFIKDYCNVKDRGKKLTKFFNRSEETMHLFLLKEMTFLQEKIFMEKEVCCQEWDKIIQSLHQLLSIILVELFYNKMQKMHKNKMCLNLNNLGGKNMKQNGYRVKIKTILKSHLIV